MRGASRNTNRVVGVDVARGVALLGMICSHLAIPDNEYRGPTRERWWFELFIDFPSSLFALVVGVTMGLMAQRGATPTHFVTRGSLLIGLHFIYRFVSPEISRLFGSQYMIGGDVTIVLAFLGTGMIVLSRAPWWETRRIAIGLIIATALVTALSAVLFLDSPLVDFFSLVLLYLYFSADSTVLMLAGLLVYRYLVGHTKRLIVAATVGLSFLAGTIGLRFFGRDLFEFLGDWRFILAVLDLATRIGASIGLCAVCLLLARSWQVILPSIGMMSLTLYSLHLATEEYVGLWPSLAAAIVIPTVWLTFFRQGPLELAMSRLTARRVRRRQEKQARRQR